MVLAFNKVTKAITQVDPLAPNLVNPANWIIDPVFDDPARAFVVGPTAWTWENEPNIHVMTEAEIDTNSTKLAATVLSQREIIDRFRDVFIASTYVDTTGRRWNTGPQELFNFVAVGVMMALQPEAEGSYVWRDAYGVEQVLTAAEMRTLTIELFQFVQQCFLICWGHKNNVAASTTIAAATTYNYTTGWPTPNPET